MFSERILLREEDSCSNEQRVSIPETPKLEMYLHQILDTDTS